MKSLEIRPGYLRIQQGVFDSRFRHVRQVANTAQADFWMTQGPTLAIRVDKSGGDSWFITWRYECGPRNVTPFSPFNNAQYNPAAGFAVDRAAAI